MIRLSNVYGSTGGSRRSSRAGLRARCGPWTSAAGRRSRLHTFDFTHISTWHRGSSRSSAVSTMATVRHRRSIFLRGADDARAARTDGRRGCGKWSDRRGCLAAQLRCRPLLWNARPRQGDTRGWSARVPLRVGLTSSSMTSAMSLVLRAKRECAMKILKVIHGYPMRYNAGSGSLQPDAVPGTRRTTRGPRLYPRGRLVRAGLSAAHRARSG